MSRKLYIILFSLIIVGLGHILTGCSSKGDSPIYKDSTPVRFNPEHDLLIANYDCKTDVDDLHSIAAFATLLRHPDYKNIQHHAVAGAYGIQSGLYVPPNDLFSISFKNENWSDAHSNYNKALKEVSEKVFAVLNHGGNIWIAEYN